MDERTTAAVDWLLASDEPAIAMMTRRDLLDDTSALEPDLILAGAKMTALLSGQQADGSFGVHPYQKWTGAHWRIVSMVELSMHAGEPRAVAAADTVLTNRDRSRRRVMVVDGLPRRCGSIDGNAMAASCRLGLADDPRAQELAAALISWQWPDGGWNCDPRATGRRSSFHETLIPAWGLHEYWLATGETAARDAAQRAAELILEHRLFRSLGTGEVINKAWLATRYPPYWHYDILHALLVLSRLGLAGDPRADDALDELERQRLPDGRWQASGYWWRPAPSAQKPEVVDWGRQGPNQMITLNALRVLRAANRL